MSADALADARRAFATAQALLRGPDLLPIPEVASAGWHDVATHPEEGSFAVVRVGLREELVGEVVRVQAQDRSVFALVVGARDVPVDVSLARSLFYRLAPLPLESLWPSTRG